MRLLQVSAVELLVDVRSFPHSRTNPQFNIETLPAELALAGIGYRHLRALGGRRPRQALGFASPNGFWRNESFRNYADYALTPPFREALAELRDLANRSSCAIMCSELAWQRCHRQIITDWLLAASVDVRHIVGPGQVDVALLNDGAQVEADGSVIYPAPQPLML